MNVTQLDFKGVKRYLPYILLVGVGIGTTNYLTHSEFNWFQWIILSSSTSFIIGFTLLFIANNKTVVKQYFNNIWKLYVILLIVFASVGILTTEIESLIKTSLFLEIKYAPFSSRNLFIPNSVISIFLGFSFFLNDRLFSKQINKDDKNQDYSIGRNQTSESELLTKIPIKQGENIQIVHLREVVYFEAFDNYSYLYDSSGQKKLCDYSLIFLENRLDKDFLRIHRKYIVNTLHIQQIIPHLNGRYLIRFNQTDLPTITSSKGYLKAMRRLVKLE